MAGRAPGPAKSKAREVRVKRALISPVYFGQAYFAPYDAGWGDRLLPTFAVDMLKFVVGQPRWPHAGSVVMLPPEFLKTTLLSQMLPLWETVRARVANQLIRGLLFSEQEAMAAGNLSVISWHLLHNERLHNDFTDKRGKPILYPDPDVQKWNDTEIVVCRPGFVSRDPTWQAKGLDSTGITGRRLDRVYGDDVVTPRNAESPAKRKSATDTWDLTVETRCMVGARVLIAGNFNDSKDLLSSLAEQSRYRLFKRPTMHKPGRPSQPPDESHLTDPARAVMTWPENWTRERALIEYRAKPNRFRRIHLLDPRAEQGDRLQVGWVQKIPDEQGAGLIQYAKLFIAFDDAPGGETEDLDFFNVTVGALTAGHLDIIQSFSARASLPRRISLLGSIYDAFANVGQGVVAIGGAKQIVDSYFAAAVKMNRPDLEHKLEPISIPHDKETRLEGLGPLAQGGWLRCWESVWEQRTSDAIDQVQELTLAEEWREFPYARHDDRLDGLDICARTAMDFALVGPVDFALAVAEQ